MTAWPIYSSAIVSFKSDVRRCIHVEDVDTSVFLVETA